MAEIDGALLGIELGIFYLLVVQLALAVVGGAVVYVSGRLGGRVGLVLVLLLAAAACGGTVYHCLEGWAHVHGRLEGRVVGPYLDAEKAETSRVWMAGSGVLGVGIAAATGIGAVFLWRRGYRHRLARSGTVAGGGGR